MYKENFSSYLPLRAFNNFFHLYDAIMHKSFVVPLSENNLLKWFVFHCFNPGLP